MAQLLAFALKEWAEAHPETDITVEVARTMVDTLVDSLGSLEKVIASLLVRHGEREVAYVPFEGSKKAEIARNVGQSIHYVHNHLALTQISPELAGRIAAGELPMGVAAIVADLPEAKRAGLTIFILANVSAASGPGPNQLTAKAIKGCAASLKQWSGLQMPLVVKHQSQRNIARALVRLWSLSLEAYPEDAYAAAAMLIYRGVHEEPWSSQEKLALWFQALGGDTYFSESGIHWPAVLEHLLIEVNCETCPIAQLPAALLRDDLAGGQGGPLGMPCQAGQAAPSTGSPLPAWPGARRPLRRPRPLELEPASRGGA
jgi:hypothetical protein